MAAAAAVGAHQASASNSTVLSSSQGKLSAPSSDSNVQLYLRRIQVLSAEIERLKSDKGKLQLRLLKAEGGGEISHNQSLFEVERNVTILTNDIARLEGEKTEMGKRCTALEISLSKETAQRQAAEKAANSFKDQAMTASMTVECLQLEVNQKNDMIVKLQKKIEARSSELLAEKRAKVHALLNEALQILEKNESAAVSVVLSATILAAGGVLIAGPFGIFAGYVGAGAGAAYRSEDLRTPASRMLKCILLAKNLSQEIGYAWPPLEANPLKKKIESDGEKLQSSGGREYFSRARVLLGIEPLGGKALLSDEELDKSVLNTNTD